METPTLKQLSNLLTTAAQPILPRSHILIRKLIVGALLVLTDTFAITISMLSSIILSNAIFPGMMTTIDYLTIFPVIIPLFPLVYYFRGLYPGFGVDVIEELRTLTYGTSVVFALLATMTFFMNGAWEYSRSAFILSWLISIPLVPLGRALVRRLFGSHTWWGIPVIIIGAGKAGEQVIKSLRKHSQIGLRPVVAVDDNIDRWGYIHQIPVIGGLNIVPELSKKLRIDHAIIAMPNVSKNKQHEIILKYSKYFSHVTIIPQLFGLSSLWVSTRDLGGILGFEVQQSLLKHTSRVKKRIFDIVVASLLLAIFSPLFLIISIVIKLDSNGRILFHQKRIGINGGRFKMIKFRTMHLDAERRLHHILKENQELKNEYSVYHKLKKDPRLTRIGKFLRKYSFDELPQFLNVIKGEMSLIGPRAYLPFEKEKFSPHEEIIFNVKPGISGLWQVTDHNATSFEERKITDIYYIRNWSMFLDFYIFVRTIGVILSGKGG